MKFNKKKLKVIQIHNWHRYGGGSEQVFLDTIRILLRNNHVVFPCIRDSRLLSNGIAGKIRGFSSGIYSRSGRRLIRKLILEHEPGLIHIHELYPFFSPWVLKDCKEMGIPVVMTCHDYRLTCPISTHLRHGDICRLCIRKKISWCVLKNCRNNILESTAYALRSLVAARKQLFHHNVTCFITPSNFVKNWLIGAGLPPDRFHCIPNMCSMPVAKNQDEPGKYIAYVGRISKEKGVDKLIAASHKVPLPFRLAGDYTSMPDIVNKAPSNVKFLGHLDRKQLINFYRKARFLVVPSIGLETFGLTVIEAMNSGLSVIASKNGALAEIIEENVTGYTYDPWNIDVLIEKIKYLWNQPEQCLEMGKNGRNKVLREYNEDTYYKRLINVYHIAINQFNDECMVRR